MPSFTIETFTTFLETHLLLAYFILFFGSYFETLIGPNFFLYGEMIFIPGAILAGVGILNIWLVITACYLGGLLGDNSSYFIGKKWGMKFFKAEARFFNHTNYQKGKDYFDKLGPKSLFFARLAGPFSWITPFLSGVYGVPYRQFFVYNTPGVILGIGQFIIIGYFFGSSYQLILSWMGEYGSIIAVAVIAVLTILYFVFKKEKALEK